MDTRLLNDVVVTKHDLDIFVATPPEQLPAAAMILCPIEILNVSTQVLDLEDLLDNFGVPANDEAYRSAVVEVSAILEALGEPPRECDLTDIQIATQVARFCRARHQVHYECPECYRAVRCAATWTFEGGFVYPAAPTCGYCDDEPVLERTGEMYAKIMPYPFEFDPETYRTAAWVAQGADDISLDLIADYGEAVVA